MRRIVSCILVIGIMCGMCTFVYAQQRLRVSSTTSTDNTGLFNALNPPFEKMFNCKVDVIAQGTGMALRTGMMGDCDVVFVHSRKDEEKFVEQGYGINRRDVMYNDFIIVGPKSETAGVKGIKNVGEAMKRIANSKARFVSRGDDSGTHKKEKEIWSQIGITPQGDWYVEAGQGMGAVLQMAYEMNAYTLTDRGTFLAYRDKVALEIVSEGDPLLFNPYGIIAVNPAKYPQVSYILGMAYIGWVTSQEGQRIIREFEKVKFGQSLFFPTAIP